MDNNISELMREALKPPAPALDDAGADSGAADYTVADIKIKAVANIRQWTEDDDLDEGESHADRLMMLMVGIADANKDGDITEDEQAVLDVALNAAWDYLSEAGASDEDLGALLNDWDADAAARVRELAAGGKDEDLDAFAFTASDQEPALDAVYKKRIVIRKGKKVRINKRISGHVRLSAKQKVGLRKARMKSHGAAAMVRRMKSMRTRKRMGIK